MDNEGGIAVGEAVDAGSAEEDSSGGIDGGSEEVVRPWSGALLVGPGLTNSVINSGVFAGVTLSINCQDGSNSTVVLWSE